VLLQKTLLHIEGLGRQLYPELDLWANAKPFLEQWVSDRYSPRGLLEKLQKRAPGWLEQLPQRPEKILEALRPAEAPRFPAAPAATANAPAHGGGERGRLLELLVAAGGMMLVNPDVANLAPAQWHPATWIFAALAAHALFVRRG
jgi:ubiquinone biosynthesis protein